MMCAPFSICQKVHPDLFSISLVFICFRPVRIEALFCIIFTLWQIYTFIRWCSQRFCNSIQCLHWNLRQQPPFLSLLWSSITLLKLTLRCLITLRSFYIKLSIPLYSSRSGPMMQILKWFIKTQMTLQCTTLLQCFSVRHFSSSHSFSSQFLLVFCWERSEPSGWGLKFWPPPSVLDKYHRQTRGVHLDGVAYICQRKKNVFHQ